VLDLEPRARAINRAVLGIPDDPRGSGRHGTVNLLLLLIVHSGRMEAAYLPAKNAAYSSTHTTHSPSAAK
jgi:hypothetical protein